MTLWKWLLLAFIILKLCGVIAWKWIWVLSPAWIVVIGACLYGIGRAIREKED